MAALTIVFMVAGMHLGKSEINSTHLAVCLLTGQQPQLAVRHNSAWAHPGRAAGRELANFLCSG